MCKRLYRLLSTASVHGTTVHYLTLDAPPKALDDRVNVHRIPFPCACRAGLLFWAVFTVWCPIYVAFKARQLRPEKYVVFGAYYSTMLTLARMFHKVPTVLFLRSLVFKVNALTKKSVCIRYLADLVERHGLRSATKLICMTAAMQRELEEFLGHPVPNVSILPNDIPPLISLEHEAEPQKTVLNNVERLIGEDTFTVLTSGVIDERKNIGLLLDVFSELGKRYEPSKLLLLVAGDGPLLEHYRSVAVKRAMRNVLFLSWVPDLSRVYDRTTLVLHPSWHEGIPNSVLEPLGLGLPVLTSNIPELREVMVYDELLFEADDGPGLATRLEHLVETPEALAELKRLCEKRRAAFQFDWEERALDLIL
ncbi:glycosyltransferase family 4 protein [Oligoflexia bacterium]|nr:glycosyltransferase family 4 protein [Oligoflexia bacterium]